MEIIKNTNNLDKNISGIYMIISPKFKIYIGSSINIKRRLNTYKNGFRKDQSKIYNSIKKYGWENHFKLILERCDREDLYKREYYWGNIYNCLDRDLGMNNELPNPYDKVRLITDETREKLSLIRKNKKHSMETRLKMSDSRKKYNHSKEVYEKIANSNRGKKRTDDQKYNLKINSGRAKIVFDTLTGVFYNSAKELSEINGVSYDYIQKRLTNKIKNNTHYSYV